MTCLDLCHGVSYLATWVSGLIYIYGRKIHYPDLSRQLLMAKLSGALKQLIQYQYVIFVDACHDIHELATCVSRLFMIIVGNQIILT